MFLVSVGWEWQRGRLENSRVSIAVHVSTCSVRGLHWHDWRQTVPLTWHGETSNQRGWTPGRGPPTAPQGGKLRWRNEWMKPNSPKWRKPLTSICQIDVPIIVLLFRIQFYPWLKKVWWFVQRLGPTCGWRDGHKRCISIMQLTCGKMKQTS